MKVYSIYKKIGKTPLEALEAFRKKRKISQAAKLTYAGRLDPMASGVLLILEGATQAEREKYMGLDKEYEVMVLFGFETDTYDLLGIPSSPGLERMSRSDRRSGPPNFAAKFEVSPRGRTIDDIKQLLKSYQGLVKLPIPAYSSVIHKGKPLFQWARADGLKNIRLPSREMKVKSVKLSARGGSASGGKGLEVISSAKLLNYINSNIKKVQGDFRQEKILKAWKKLLSKNINKYQLVNISISVSSGTYIRSITHDLGKKLKTGGVVYSLERTRVGKYKIPRG